MAKAKKASPKAAQRSRSSKASTKSAKRPSASHETVKAKQQTHAYASVPKPEIVKARSISIPLEKTDYSETPSFAPSIPAPSLEQASASSSLIHSFSAVIFLLFSIIGFAFALWYVRDGSWLAFLLSLLVMILCLDVFMSSMRRRQEAKHPLELAGMDNMHQFTMHVFLLLAIVGIVFALTFWLSGRYVMLLLALGAAVVAFDNMVLAKKKHEIH